jgi:hypothetical protein
MPPWFLDDLFEDLPPNPPNSPAHFPTEIYTQLPWVLLSTLIFGLC